MNYSTHTHQRGPPSRSLAEFCCSQASADAQEETPETLFGVPTAAFRALMPWGPCNREHGTPLTATFRNEFGARASSLGCHPSLYGETGAGGCGWSDSLPRRSAPAAAGSPESPLTVWTRSGCPHHGKRSCATASYASEPTLDLRIRSTLRAITVLQAIPHSAPRERASAPTRERLEWKLRPTSGATEHTVPAQLNWYTRRPCARLSASLAPASDRHLASPGARLISGTTAGERLDNPPTRPHSPKDGAQSSRATACCGCRVRPATALVRGLTTLRPKRENFPSPAPKGEREVRLHASWESKSN